MDMQNLDQNAAIFDLRLVCFQIDACRHAQGFAGAVIELSVMLGAFDGVVHHQPIAEMHFFMCARPSVQKNSSSGLR